MEFIPNEKDRRNANTGSSDKINIPSEVMRKATMLDRRFNHVIEDWRNSKITSYIEFKKKLLIIKLEAKDMELSNTMYPNVWLKIVKVKYLVDLAIQLNAPVDLNKPIDFDKVILKW